jgi:hypothetical protein
MIKNFGKLHEDLNEQYFSVREEILNLELQLKDYFQDKDEIRQKMSDKLKELQEIILKKEQLNKEYKESRI